MTVSVGKLWAQSTVEADMKQDEAAEITKIFEAVDRQDTAAEFWIPGSLDRDENVSGTDFKAAMRYLAGGVVVVTVGDGPERTGFTATSVVSLSAEPPRLMFGISQGSSSWRVLQEYGTFSVNILSQSDRETAERFAGRGGLKGPARYGQDPWRRGKTGAPFLTKAMATFDCTVDEILLRYDHAIVIARVKAVWHGDADAPLIYWDGGYGALSQ